MREPLLTSVRISPSCKPRMRVTVTVSVSELACMRGSRARMRHRSAAHSDQWQDLELIFRRLLEHGNMRKRREVVEHVSLISVETFMGVCLRPTAANVSVYKMHKQSSADCCWHREITYYLLVYGCRYPKVFKTRMDSSLPYRINTQNAVCATYIYANTDWRTYCL